MLRGPTLKPRQRLTLRAVRAGPGRDQVGLGVAEGVLAGVAGALRAQGWAEMGRGGERGGNCELARQSATSCFRCPDAAGRRCAASVRAPRHTPQGATGIGLQLGAWAGASGGRGWGVGERRCEAERQRGAPSPTRRLAALTLSLPLQVPWPEQELLQPANAVAARRSTQAMMRMVSSGELEWEGRADDAPRRTTPLCGLCRARRSRAAPRRSDSLRLAAEAGAKGVRPRGGSGVWPIMHRWGECECPSVLAGRGACSDLEDAIAVRVEARCPSLKADNMVALLELAVDEDPAVQRMVGHVRLVEV